MNIKLNKQDNKKHILYLCSRNFFTPNTGHEIKMFNYIKGLKKTFNCDIDLFIFDKPSKDEINIKKYVSNITYGKSNNHLITFCNLFFKTLFNNWPIQNSLYYNKDNFNEIKKIAQNTHYDMLIVDMIRLDAYSNAIEYPCLKVLDMDDLLSKRYQRQLSKLNKKSSIAGAYEEKLNPFIRFFIKNKIIKKIILKMEIKRLKIAEEKAHQKYDHLLFVSQKEADEININYHNHKAIGIGLGVDYSYFSKELNIKEEKDSASFLGNMYYPPNADSIRYIIDNIVNKSKYLKHFYIIGKCPDNLKNEYINNDKVIFLGRVEDIRTIIKKTKVFLSPIVYGTGIKTKILEALAMGSVVITNDVGSEGIDLTNGLNVIIENDEQKLVNILDDLLRNDEKRLMIQKEAKKFAKENLDWDIIFENLKQIEI